MFNRFFWVGLKSQPASGNARKGRSGQLPAHTQAVRDNIAFDIEQIIAKANTPQSLLTEGTPEAL